MAERGVRRRLRNRAGLHGKAASRRRARSALTAARLRRQLESARNQLVRREHLVGELSIHREELQAQNEALMRAERDLWVARDRLTDLFQRAPIPYLTLNSAALIAAANWNATKFLGREPEQIVGSPFALFVTLLDRPRFRQHIAACRRKREPTLVELTLTLPVGLVPVHLSSTLTGDGWIYTAIIDLRDREQAEQERRRLAVKAEAARAGSEAKDQFLATLSHELRTPLTPVVAAVSALERICGAAGLDGDQLFATIRRNLAHEVRLIDDLLDVTRLTHHKLTLDRREVDVHGVVREAHEQVRSDADGKGVHIQVALQANYRVVRGDADRLRQVFANLLRNAIKFTPTHGDIKVTSRNRDSYLCVSVQDSGEGLPPGEQQRIFERFVQGSNARPREGLGLGLPIAHGIVTAHGGQLGVFSAGPGQGATFEVRLRYLTGARKKRPVEPAARPASETSWRALPATTAGTRILFVEDHQDTARLLTRLLERAGYAVTLADSVATALAQLNGTVDLLVSDIGLPDGSGLDLMRQVVARLGPVPAIALSGYGTREDIRRSRAAGFKRHLVKPVELPALVKAIEDLRTTKARAR